MSDNEVSSSKHYIGKDKSTKWRKVASKRKAKTKKRNIVTHLPGAKLASKQCFSLFINDEIVNCTNIKIEKDSEKNIKNNSAYKTDEVEIKAVIGLLLLAGSVKSGHQNLSRLWNVNRMGIELFATTMSLKRFVFITVSLL